MTLIKVRHDGTGDEFVLLDEDALTVSEDDEVYLVTVSNAGHDVSIEPCDFRTVAIAHA